MSSPEAPTPVKTTRRTPKGPRVPRSTELKHAFLQKPFWTPPRVQAADRYIQEWPQQKTRAPVSNAGGDLGSGPSPTASTKPRRDLQLSPS
jgi:hypothetical protein